MEKSIKEQKERENSREGLPHNNANSEDIKPSEKDNECRELSSEDSKPQEPKKQLDKKRGSFISNIMARGSGEILVRTKDKEFAMQKLNNEKEQSKVVDKNDEGQPNGHEFKDDRHKQDEVENELYLVWTLPLSLFRVLRFSKANTYCSPRGRTFPWISTKKI